MFSSSKIKILLVEDQQSYIQKSRVRSTYQKIQQFKVTLTEKNLNTQIQSWINRSKYRSTDQKRDNQIKS